MYVIKGDVGHCWHPWWGRFPNPKPESAWRGLSWDGDPPCPPQGSMRGRRRPVPADNRTYSQVVEGYVKPARRRSTQDAPNQHGPTWWEHVNKYGEPTERRQDPRNHHRIPHQSYRRSCQGTSQVRRERTRALHRHPSRCKFQNYLWTLWRRRPSLRHWTCRPQ